MTDHQPGTARSARGLSAVATRLPRWRFVLLLRVVNFAILRRYLGRAGAACLSSELGARLTSAIPGARIVETARDSVELAFEAEGLDDGGAAVRLIASLLGQRFAIDGELYDVECAVGVAATDAADDEVRLIETAERALAESVAQRQPVMLDLADRREQVDRIELERDLKRAIEREELFLQYQPKVHLRRQEIAGVEALIRWRHPERGLVLPGDFIPIAEETRVIGALTLWTIRQALADQKVLASVGHDLPVFVNIAGALLGDAPFIREVGDLIRGTAGRIGIEVTETSVIRDPEGAIANLKSLAELGVPIAIDDYGAGLSSLAYLKRLPARELKIDKLFVTQLTSSNRDPLIVRSTIDLAHALEMEVVAEGVETEAALALLSVMGCDVVQGFLISRPIGLYALIDFLRSGRGVGTVVETRATFSRLAASWKRG